MQLSSFSRSTTDSILSISPFTANVFVFTNCFSNDSFLFLTEHDDGDPGGDVVQADVPEPELPKGRMWGLTGGCEDVASRLVSVRG